MSIRKKLIILFLSIAIIPVLFVSIITFSNARKALYKQQLEKLEAIADLKVDKIESFFYERMGDIKTAQDYYNIKSNLSILAKISNDITNPVYTSAKKMLDLQLKTLQKVNNYENIMLVGLQGKIVYVANEDNAAKDLGNTLPGPSDRSFEEGKKRLFYSDIYRSKKGGKGFEMLLTAPVHDFNEKFIGVIAFQIDMASIYKLIQDTTGLGRTGETLIGKKIGNKAVFLNPLRHDPEAALERKVSIGSRVAIPIQEAVQGREGSMISIDYRDKEILSVWRHIPLLDWGLVAKIDTQEAFALVTSLTYVSAISLGVILIIVTITAFVSAKSISKPIITLTNASKSLASGDLSQKVDIPLKDEIGDLAHSFNSMAEDLSLSMDNLVSAKDYTDNIISSMTDALIVISPDGYIKTVNKATCTILGYEDKELINQAFGMVIDDENLHGIKLADLVKKDLIVNKEVTYLTKNGRKIPMSLTGSAMRDKDGKLTGIVAAARDMREIQQLIAELRTSYAYSESIVTTIPSGVVALDEEGRVLSTNPGFRTLFGKTYPGKRFYELVLSVELKNAIEKILIESGEVHNIEITKKFSGESDKTLSVSVVGLRIEEGVAEKKPASFGEKDHRARVLVVFDDITERNRLMLKLENKIEELKRTQAQLVQSGKLAAVGELAAGVAHEINNPLSGVLIYACLLKDKFDDSSEAIHSQLPKFSDQLDKIKIAAERCKMVSDNLLSFSRQSEAVISLVDISDVITKTLELIGVQLCSKQIKLNREIQNGLPAIKGDSIQIQQVFTNIVLNAIYFIDKEQEGEITIRTRMEEGMCEVSISDNGPGIARENLSRIFDPFYTTKPIGKGTGLGLSISYGIIENHGGQITVDSLLGRGTTFTIKLPIVEGKHGKS